MTSSFLSSIFPQFLVRKTWHLVRDLEFRKWQSSKIFHKWEGSFFMSFFNNCHVFHLPTVIHTNLAPFQKFMLEIPILTTTFLLCILNNYFLNFHQINVNPSLYFVSLCVNVDFDVWIHSRILRVLFSVNKIVISQRFQPFYRRYTFEINFLLIVYVT